MRSLIVFSCSLGGKSDMSKMVGNLSREEHDQLKAKLVARAWTDEAFRDRLKDDPCSVIREYGYEVPSGVTLRVLEEDDRNWYMVLPPAPAGDLSMNEQELEAVAGGQIYHNPDFSIATAISPTIKKTF